MLILEILMKLLSHTGNLAQRQILILRLLYLSNITSFLMFFIAKYPMQDFFIELMIIILS